MDFNLNDENQKSKEEEKLLHLRLLLCSLKVKKFQIKKSAMHNALFLVK